MPDSELNEYVRVLRLRKWWVIGVLALVLAAAYAYTRIQTPMYASIAEVLVSPTPVLGFSQAPQPPPTLNMETEQSVAMSTQAARYVADNVDGRPSTNILLDNVSVTVKPGTEILEFEYLAADPDAATERAAAFAQAYLDLRRDQRLDALEDTGSAIREQIAEADSRSTREALEVSLAELEAVLRAGINPGSVVRPATVPSEPATPSYPKNLALAGLLGLGLGVAVAFLRDRFDDRLRDKASLEAHCNAPVLAVVPKTRRIRFRRRRAREDDIITLTDPISPAADAYRALRAGVIYLDADLQPGISKMKVLMVTSPGPREGKSTLTANLGVALAKAEKEVICVGADLHRPRLGEMFGSETQLGLANVLAGDVDVEQVLVKTNVPGLRFLDTGGPTKNARELLETPAMAGAIERLNGLADFVLIDTPPVLASPDTITMAPLVDGIILVAASEQTKIRSLREAAKQLRTLNATILGGVLNMHKPSRSADYNGYYRYAEHSQS